MIDFNLQKTWSLLPEKVDRMIDQLGDRCPSMAGHDGVYDDVPAHNWVSGFWPSILWLMHDMTGKTHYREAAWDWDRRIEEWTIKENDFCHDVGFQFLGTAVFKYRLTGDSDARRRGFAAAEFLAGRFNLPGRFFRAWKWNGDEGIGIIDCTMNLSLLYWASEVSGDPRFKHLANAHADTVVRYFVRPDGSSSHVVKFDPETGEFLESRGGQGFGPDSAWSRGQAWALYGLSNVYRYTGDSKYLHAAKQVAHYYLSALPEDGLPYWDFRLPAVAGEPKDTSAAAIAASGLIELANLVPESESELYRNGAIKLLSELTKRYGTWDEPAHQAILKGGTAHRPRDMGIDVSLIYGDYYYVEALAKLNGWRHRIY